MTRSPCRGAVTVAALALAGCRGGPHASTSDAAVVAATGTSLIAGVDAAPDAGSARPAPASRPLPPPERLLAPFRGTSARGFVAMTNMDSAAVHERRTFISLGQGETFDGAKPVLVASFTKLWTAVATLRMMERGELSLDDTVKTSLPELAARPWASSTIRELLTHTSLVPELYDKEGYWRVDVDLSLPVAALAKHVPQNWTEKRGIYKYRNSEFAIVGAILARRSKMPAERVLAREVFEPAGMEHAGLLVTTAPPGLDLGPMGPIHPQNFFTAGAGYASATDLLSFFEALAGKSLLSDESKALLFDGATDRNRGALGCWVYPFPQADGAATRFVERPGSFGNVRVFAAFFPDDNRAIVAWNAEGIDFGRPRSGKGIGLALARVAIE